MTGDENSERKISNTLKTVWPLEYVNGGEGEDQHDQEYKSSSEDLLARAGNLLDSRSDQKIGADFDETPKQALLGLHSFASLITYISYKFYKRTTCVCATKLRICFPYLRGLLMFRI